MSDNSRAEPSDGREDPVIGWKDRVKFADHVGGGFAYRPHDVLTTQPVRALEIAQASFLDAEPAIEIAEYIGPFARLVNVPDPLRLIDLLRFEGITAQPNHVMFTHCGCCAPHPAFGGFYPAGINPAGVNPAGINPAGINPAGINPAGINPAGINPAGINPDDQDRVTGVRRSSARPATPTTEVADALEKRICTQARLSAPKVVVLDTGLATEQWCPMLTSADAIQAAPGSVRDEPDNDLDEFLDYAAGHGTFIAGIINQVAPGCDVTVHRVASIYGDTDESSAATIIDNLASNEHTILSLSFGGTAMDQKMAVLAWAIGRFQMGGGVVVASAGNDSSCIPTFPAALRDVVSVGAVGRAGPAVFTNYGPWVRACAPGVKLTSLFFDGFQGKGQAGADGIDPDKFKVWAVWSGTSFSAPVVVGALARMMMWARVSAPEAVKRIIDPPELMRIPNLGTVVNVI
jgi:hypothetical protein